VEEGKGSNVLGMKENKCRFKERNEDQPCGGSYYVDKPNPLGLGFWVIM